MFDLIFETGKITKEQNMIYPGFKNISSNGYVDVLLNEYKNLYVKENDLDIN